MERPAINPVCKFLKPLLDLTLTLLLWLYYTAGFVFLFAPFYIGAYFFAKDVEKSFQRLNHNFYRGFFFLLRSLMPMAKWQIDDAIPSLRSAVIVCNHVSYLDSILMISLFERHTTIVKSRFFRIPILRQVINLSGYIPSDADAGLGELIAERIDKMESFLASGGNLFIFPEGTRSRDGCIKEFNKGAFKIARLCNRPITVMSVKNTDRVFTPGKFLFDSCFAGEIQVRLLGTVAPDYQDKAFSISELMQQVRSLLEEGRPKSFS